MTGSTSSSSNNTTEWLQFDSSSSSDADQDILFHYSYKFALGGNYVSPINKNNLKTCLDINYGSGSWMMEMATEFPETMFYGIDHDPRTPDLVYPPNCIFQRGDFLKELPYPNNSFDYLHIQNTLFWIEDEKLKSLLSDALRVTRGGRYIEFLEQGLQTKNAGPLLTKYIEVWKQIREARAIGSLVSQIEDLFREKAEIQIKNFYVPIGKWAGFSGEFFLSALKLFILETASLTSEILNLRTEDDYKNFVEKIGEECELHKPSVNIYVGYAQKL
ncbi:hypothetical protein Glove_187g116 [Diversispora epigaea]|uniref:Methyltransferase domain-containing protein n=1 Tax=Diversispora epigaea TaxID=1348612 RepID=A0A397IQ15_9GLOM|nr:hypothetical protein Glove_187g116 [Diversispora epigaea]